KFYRSSVARSTRIGDDASPWYVLADQFAFVERKERVVSLIGEHGEESLDVWNLAAEMVRHADGIRRDGVNQSLAVRRARNDVIDQHAAIDEIDLLAIGG